jgi:hypothetical protein
MSFAAYLASRVPEIKNTPANPSDFVDSFLHAFEEDLSSGNLDKLVHHWNQGKITVFVEIARRLNLAVYHSEYFNWDSDAMGELEEEVCHLLQQRFDQI